MATGTLLPLPRYFAISAGISLPGGKLYVYEAGTSTPANTFPSSSMTPGTENANPIVADPTGLFGAIYILPGSSYKVILTTSAGATIYTQDNIAAYGVSTVQSNNIGVCCGRMTLTSGLAVTTADVTAATTIYYAPYAGNQIALYYAGQWNIYTFSELSLSLAAQTASRPYDLWAYYTGATVALEALVWTSDTTRATSLTTQDGVLVKSGDATRRYLGTYRTTTVTGQTEDSFAKRFVWNYYNRVPRAMRVTDLTNSWTYTTNTYRIANNVAGNQLAFVVGVAEISVSLDVIGYAANDTTAEELAVSIGVDSLTVPSVGVTAQYGSTAAAALIGRASASYVSFPAAGYHFAAWLEKSITTGNTTTWYGDNGAASQLQAGISGVTHG